MQCGFVGVDDRGGSEMKRFMILAGILCLLPGLVLAGSPLPVPSTLETTFEQNNTQKGNYFELKVLAAGGITISKWKGHFQGPGDFKVFLRSGSYGSSPGATGWNQVASGTVPASIVSPFIYEFSITPAISLAQGTYTVLVSNSGSVKYTGDNSGTLGQSSFISGDPIPAVGQLAYDATNMPNSTNTPNNSELQIMSGYGTEDEAPNGGVTNPGYAFYPRIVNVTLTYDVTPVVTVETSVFKEDFEDATFDGGGVDNGVFTLASRSMNFLTANDPDGRAAVGWGTGTNGVWATGLTAANGSGCARMSLVSSPAGGNHYLCNMITMKVSLTGATNATLKYFIVESGDESHDPWSGPASGPWPGTGVIGGGSNQSGMGWGDGVAISADGTNWYELKYEIDPPNYSVWSATPVSIDIDAMAATLQIPSFSLSTFYLRFLQYDNYPYASDGLLFDDIEITSNGSWDTPVVVTPNVSIGNVTVTEGNSGTTTASFPVTLTAASSTAVTVSYTTTDGTAKVSDNDYVGVTTAQTLTIPANTTTATIDITVNGDTAVEPNETFTVTIANATGAIIQTATGTGTITNDDVAPTTETTVFKEDFEDASMDGGGVSALAFKLAARSSFFLASNDPEGRAGLGTGNWGTGSNGVWATGLTAANGTGCAQMSLVTTTNYHYVCNMITLRVELTGATNATLKYFIAENGEEPHDMWTGSGNGPWTGTGAPGTGAAGYGAGWGDGIAISADGTNWYELKYESDPPDYSSGWASTPVSIDIDAMAATLQLPSFSLSTFYLRFMQLDNYPFYSDALLFDDIEITSDGTWTSSTALPVVSIGDVSVTEGNSGTTTASFPVSVSPASSSAVTVTYTTADGTATVADNDYVGVTTTQTLTIPAGTTSATIDITVNGDTAVELDETFTVTIANASGATISTATGTGTITNDDATSLQVQTIFVGGNTFNGNYFELKVGPAGGVTVTSMTGNINTPGTVEVWARPGVPGLLPGTAGWTQVATAVVSASGPQVFATNFFLATGSHTILFSNSGGVLYTNGTLVGSVAGQDANLKILEGHGTGDLTPVGTSGYAFSPRIWNGIIQYTLGGPAAVNTVPDAPAIPTQADSNGSLAVGATTSDTTVKFKAIVSDGDMDLVELQVEVKPVGTAFTGTPNATSQGFVVSGNSAGADVTGLTVNKYHWQARTKDSQGATGAWVSFGGNNDSPLPADTDFEVLGIVPPNTPPTVVAASLNQLESNGTTVIVVGGTTTDSTLVFKAQATDPNVGNMLKIVVELAPISQPWGGLGSMTGTSASFAPGQTGTVTIQSVPIGKYHWRVRANDNALVNNTGAWVSYGSNSDGNPPALFAAVDFEVQPSTVNNDPTLIVPTQHTGAGVPILQGGTTTGTTLVFKALVADVDPGQTVKLEVRAAPVNEAFGGTATMIGSSALLASGSHSVTLSPFADGDWYWEARAVDSLGATSNWVPFGTNSNGNPPATNADTDFTVDTSGGGGGSYCAAGGTTGTGFISSVKITDLGGNVIMENSSGDTGYADYTTMAALNVAVTIGKAYTIQVGATNATGWSCFLWVDWNGDLDFDDPLEILPLVPSGTTKFSAAFTVAGSVLPGATRMRLRLWDGTGTPDACGALATGEVEDYRMTASGSVNPGPGTGGGGGSRGGGCGSSIADAPLPWGLLALLSLVLFFPGRRRI
jgi:MYXO-CTERM domain-containing protein